jgi:hypothetical protein
VASVKKREYRNRKGQFTSAYNFALELKAGLVKYRYADKSRIREKKQIFINRKIQEYSQQKENKRQRQKYQRQKREKKTGRHFEKPIEIPIVQEISKTGEIRQYEEHTDIETYVRYGYGLRPAGSNTDSPPITASGAITIRGKYSLEEILRMTKPESFYNGWNRYRPMIEAGEYEIVMMGEKFESGIHYQLQRRDISGYVYPLVETETHLNGYDMMQLT